MENTSPCFAVTTENTKKRNTLFVLEQLTSAKSLAKSCVFLFMIGMKIDTGAQAVCLACDKTGMAFGVL